MRQRTPKSPNAYCISTVLVTGILLSPIVQNVAAQSTPVRALVMTLDGRMVPPHPDEAKVLESARLPLPPPVVKPDSTLVPGLSDGGASITQAAQYPLGPLMVDRDGRLVPRPSDGGASIEVAKNAPLPAPIPGPDGIFRPAPTTSTQIKLPTDTKR